MFVKLTSGETREVDDRTGKRLIFEGAAQPAPEGADTTGASAPKPRKRTDTPEG